MVDAGNGKFNLMIICWGEGHGSAIHDHADSHCFMKILKGELVESRYAWPTNEINNNNNNNNNENDTVIWRSNEEKNSSYDSSELQLLGKSPMEKDSVHYINGL